MRLTRVVRHPLTILTAVVCAAVGFGYRSTGEVGWGVVGALVGLLLGLMSLQVGMLVGAVLLGARVHKVVIGIGTRLVDWTTARRAVVLRAVPLLLSVSVGPGKAPARKRMWGAALCSAFAAIATVAATALAVSDGFSLGLAIACAAAVAHALVPRKLPGSTSTGWLVLHLPRMSGVQAQQLDAAPLVTATVDAVQDGELARASAMAAELSDRYPSLRTATAARVLVLQAQGRYAEALLQAMAIAGDTTQTPQEAAVSFAALAGLAYATVESGQLSAELGMGTADQALENAETLGYPTHRLDGCRALRELILGNTARAISLARHSANTTDDRLGRADDLATLARAHMAAGDNKAARTALTEAEQVVPWWPRVAETRTRLDIA
ncbi:hypothetical protein [Actinokineospora terrae]|uniref:Tetratricopeptide repeat-containing protein n=1 Tax=Actinokineospora terrae TaxID=155974 RepID=A0A1H9QK66_9PSEU|nr:hypothetical protein [Actinokineospora terrae]SER60585.1 hypothetical protein SAMN04487818_104307 [Actinokineospora terrae]